LIHGFQDSAALASPNATNRVRNRGLGQIGDLLGDFLLLFFVHGWQRLLLMLLLLGPLFLSVVRRSVSSSTLAMNIFIVDGVSTVTVL
jgi:hypothetical protein